MAAPLKVLIIQAELPRYRLPLFKRLAAAWPDMHLAVACCVDHTADDDQIEKSQLEVITLGASRLGPFRWHRNLLARVRECDVAVVMFDARWLSCMWTALLYPKKSLLWGHGLGRSGIVNRFRLFLARRVAGVLVYEERAKAAFLDNGCDPERVFAVGNTIEVIQPARREGSRSRFLFVGRLQRRKRIDELLHAFAKVISTLPNFVGVTIVGDGPAREELEAIVGQLEISDRVEFVGAIHDPDGLANQYGRAIAYVSPDAVGLGVLQAFGHGVPVITRESASHGPEFENITNGFNGRIYDGGVEELSRVLVWMCQQPESAEHMGVNALRRYVHERSIDQMAQRFVTAMRQVVRGHGGNEKLAEEVSR